MEQSYLSHHGVDGMKWGIRRYQNEDGTRTALGQRHRREIEGTEGSRESSGSKVKNFVKNNAGTIAKVALATAAVAGTAYLISHNKAAIGSTIKSMSGKTISSLNSAKSTVDAGKAFVGKTLNKVSSGAKKAGQAAKDFHNSKDATAFREQAKKTASKVSNYAKDPKYREAAKTYAKAYGKGAADLGKTVGKTAAKVAAKTGKFVEKQIEKTADNIAKGKKPKFVKAKIAAGSIIGYNVAKAGLTAKSIHDSNQFEKQYRKEWKEQQKAKQ